MQRYFFLLVVMMIIWAVTGLFFIQEVCASSVFAGGTGTEEDPYQVATAEQLNSIRDDFLDKHFLQITDLDVSEVPGSWEPIGSHENRFSGSYDGGGYAINNLAIGNRGTNGQGLFSYAHGAVLKNIRIVNASILEEADPEERIQYTGILVGRIYNSTIDNVHISGQVTTTSNTVGGMVGAMHGGIIHYASADVVIRGYGKYANSYGGIVGFVCEYNISPVNSAFRYANLRHVFSRGLVENDRDQSGGLVGSAGKVLIADCYSHSSVSATNHVGGLIGAVSNHTTVTRSYSAGYVEGTGDQVGGLIGTSGHPNWTLVKFSYWDTETSGQLSSALGEGLTTDQMHQQENYQTYNFNTLWQINGNNSYPEFYDLSLYQQPQDIELAELEGSGTAADPYIITNADELNALRKNMTAHYRLSNDIDLSSTVAWNNGQGWMPIGSTPPGTSFRGSLDGSDYAISNLCINRAAVNYQGLFGVSSQSTIKNLALENVNIQVMRYNSGSWDYSASGIGALVGMAGTSSLENLSASGIISSTDNAVGGLIGSLSGTGTLDGALADMAVYNSGYFQGAYSGYVGGLIGRLNANINEVYSLGFVSSNGNHVGGLVGYIESGTVSNAYSRADVEGYADYVGGLMGSQDGNIYNAYSAGQVFGEGESVGGFAGAAAVDALAEHCYWDMEVSGQVSSIRGTGRTTSQMTYPYDADTYLNWDFETIWLSDQDYQLNDGYPQIKKLTPAPASWTNIISLTPHCLSYNRGTITASFEEVGIGLYDGAWSVIAPDVTAVTLSTDGNILVASVEDHGVWSYDGGWIELTKATADLLAVDNGKVAASFEGSGIWHFDGDWQMLTPATARALAYDDGRLVASVDGFGTWLNDGEWQQLTAETAQLLALSGNDLVASFDSFGTWHYDGEWTNLTPAAARALALDNGMIAASVDGFGTWFYDGEWQQLTVFTAQLLGLDSGSLAAVFESAGVWLYE